MKQEKDPLLVGDTIVGHLQDFNLQGEEYNDDIVHRDHGTQNLQGIFTSKFFEALQSLRSSKKSLNLKADFLVVKEEISFEDFISFSSLPTSTFMNHQ